MVAYFCMEYGLDASFPIYSGGLGVLAGDFIKSAHDRNLPMVAVGLCWERGYGAQKIGPDGLPAYEYPAVDLSFLEDTEVRVRVRKLTPPMEGLQGIPGVELVRRRISSS